MQHTLSSLQGFIVGAIRIIIDIKFNTNQIRKK